MPVRYKDAIAGPDATFWLEAMSAKVQFSMALGAWEFTEEPPERRVLDGKWVYSIKTDVNGNFIK